ncbi:MAG TPA: cation diffusion facilitator family transporter [Deltaproteobacteria bacterium]|nr:cation diffusion facilitator family transporter [Deltaproteobacteria bacterium]HQB38994.1 cation diffusion facilitator family transporter [Deltaproteobacteria bacterium]
MHRDERFNRAERIIRIGLCLNAVLMVVKLSAGYWGQSDAVFADGIESGCDFVAVLMTMLALRMGRIPYDASHPYGHGRAENLAALLIGMVIVITGVWIMIDAIQTIVSHSYKAPHLVAVFATLLTILVKEWLFRITRKTGQDLNSPSLLAVAADHRKDALSSIGTLAGVAGAWLGLGIMDPLAAALTALFILHIGYVTLSDAAHDLMDGSAPPDFLNEVSRLAENVEHVEHVHEIRSRRSGQYVIIDLKLDMDPLMTVKQSHAVATQVKRVIFDRYDNVGDVMIHINPHEEEHEDLIRL